MGKNLLAICFVLLYLEGWQPIMWYPVSSLFTSLMVISPHVTKSLRDLAWWETPDKPLWGPRSLKLILLSMANRLSPAPTDLQCKAGFENFVIKQQIEFRHKSQIWNVVGFQQYIFKGMVAFSHLGSLPPDLVQPP